MLFLLGEQTARESKKLRQECYIQQIQFSEIQSELTQTDAKLVTLEVMVFKSISWRLWSLREIWSR